MVIDGIIGHYNVRKYFQQAIKLGILAHAHIISGDDGIGKSLIVKEAAMTLLNKNELRQYVDIVEFKSNKSKRSIGVDDAREIIIEVNKKPFEGEKKVIIIYGGERITVQAQNALLKTIEEPPTSVYIFILCENLELVLDTIRSRCQVHKLNKLNMDEIALYIKRKYNQLTTDEFSTAMSFSNGIPGRVEKFIENNDFKEIRNITARMLIDINTMKNSQIFVYEQFFLKYKDEWEEILAVLLTYIRDIIIYKDTGNESLIINKDKLKELKDSVSLFSYNKLDSIVKIIDYTRDNFNSNTNTALAYDVMLLKMLDA